MILAQLYSRDIIIPSLGTFFEIIKPLNFQVEFKCSCRAPCLKQYLDQN